MEWGSFVLLRCDFDIHVHCWKCYIHKYMLYPSKLDAVGLIKVASKEDKAKSWITKVSMKSVSYWQFNWGQLQKCYYQMGQTWYLAVSHNVPAQYISVWAKCKDTVFLVDGQNTSFYYFPFSSFRFSSNRYHVMMSHFMTDNRLAHWLLQGVNRAPKILLLSDDIESKLGSLVTSTLLFLYLSCVQTNYGFGPIFISSMNKLTRTN